MKTLELRKKSATEISKEITTWREQAATLVRSRGLQESKNVRELRALRKDIARGLTILSDKKRESSLSEKSTDKPQETK